MEKKLRELGLFSLHKKRFWVDLMKVFQYIKMTYKEDREMLLTKACSDRLRENGFKLNENRFKMDIRKKFFYGADDETLKQVL